jgi:hypothetical protein
MGRRGARRIESGPTTRAAVGSIDRGDRPRRHDTPGAGGSVVRSCPPVRPFFAGRGPHCVCGWQASATSSCCPTSDLCIRSTMALERKLGSAADRVLTVVKRPPCAGASPRARACGVIWRSARRRRRECNAGGLAAGTPLGRSEGTQGAARDRILAVASKRMRRTQGWAPLWRRPGVTRGVTSGLIAIKPASGPDRKNRPVLLPSVQTHGR